MSALAETQELQAVRSAWLDVFKTNDPFGWPFDAKLSTGRLFFPTDGYHLTEHQYDCIVSASRRVGEDKFFMSIVESEDLSFLDRTWGHWACDRPSYDEYANLPVTLENALFSETGTWGVMISHEMHALIGGSRRFISALDQEYSEWDSDLRLLLETWSENPNAGWLETIVPHCSNLGVRAPSTFRKT